jgi:RND family efflux transporter MFP subunit
MTRLSSCYAVWLTLLVSVGATSLAGCAWKPEAKTQTKLFELAPAKDGKSNPAGESLDALKQGQLAEPLRSQFQALGVDVPEGKTDALVALEEEGRWKLKTDRFEFFLKAEGPKLAVYKEGGPLPLLVEYVAPSTRNVIEYEEFTGRTAATESVELRARVSGYLSKIHFEDGVDVAEGDLLFTLDDRPFTAEEQRTASLIKQFEARINRLHSQEKRSRALFDKQAISQDEYETIKYDLDEAEATLAAAKASHEVAKLNLQFTKITAPLSGRIGRRMVDEGNLVIEDQTALATIVPLDKVFVYFDMDERTVLKLRRLGNGGEMSAMKSDVIVDIALADANRDANDAEAFPLKGKIDFLDNQIDPATGTLRVRAVVENPTGLLSPGLFVRLRYPIGKEEPSMVIPEASLASDQGNPFVFVINDKHIVEARPVVLGPQVDSERVVRSGLSAGERVAVTGLQRLRRSMEVIDKDQTHTKAAEAMAADKKSQSIKAPKVSAHQGAE